MSDVRIEKTGDYEVTLTTDPGTDKEVSYVYWISRSGGQVRQGEEHRADDPTVCAGLKRRGNVITAADGDDLLEAIKEGWEYSQRLKKHADRPQRQKKLEAKPTPF